MAEEDDFPAEIKQYFENEKILEIESYSSSEQLFAAIARDQNHERVLYAFQQINGKWVCFAKTKNAIPKMELKAIVSVSDTYQDRSDKGVQNVPNISIRFLEPNEDHSELWMNFLLDGDRYILRDVIPHHGSIRYENGAVFIYEDDCFASQRGYVQYPASADLTAFVCDDFLSCAKKWDHWGNGAAVQKRGHRKGTVNRVCQAVQQEGGIPSLYYSGKVRVKIKFSIIAFHAMGICLDYAQMFIICKVHIIPTYAYQKVIPLCTNTGNRIGRKNLPVRRRHPVHPIRQSVVCHIPFRKDPNQDKSSTAPVAV